MLKVAESEIKSISLWILVMVAVIGGLFAGFLGGARLRAHAVAGVRARRPDESCRGNRPLRSGNLSQLRNNITRHQRKCGYYDCAGDAHRRSCWRVDWSRLDAILSRPANSLGVLTFAASGGGSGCLWLGHWTPNEVIQSEW